VRRSRQETTTREGEMTEATMARRTRGCAPQPGQRCDEASQLTIRAAAGDQAAWNELIGRYSRMLWAIASQHRLSAADAADVFQTTWLRLVEHIDRLSDPGRVGAWLATTARRECLRVIQVCGRQVPVGDDFPELVAPATDPAAELLRAERDAELREAMSCLRERDEQLLLMLASDAAPGYTEIAEALGMPIGSIGPTRARSLERVRREYARQAA
jgi:RNA polymerase sigma factor (sigma-70 family)